MREKKPTLVAVVLLGLLLTVGTTLASDRHDSTRTPALRSVTDGQVGTQASLSLTKLLRVRFARALQLLAELDAVQPDPPVFGTDGLSDGPDPIDGSGQAGDGPSSPPKDKTDDQQSGGGSSGANGSSLQSN